MVALLVILMVATALGIDWAVRAYRRSNGVPGTSYAHILPLPEWAKLPLEKLKAPAGLFYGRGHTWLQVRGDGALRVGIDDFLSHALGPLDEFEFVPNGTSVKRGEPIAQLKQDGVSIWVRSPVSGKVSASNESVAGLAVQHDPYGKGWLAELQSEDVVSEIAALRMGKSVLEWFRNEALRYGRMLVETDPALAYVTMQDGGIPLQERLAVLGPERAAAFDHAFLRYADGE